MTGGKLAASKALALIRSSHPIPCLAVATFAGMFCLSNGTPFDRGLTIFLAVLFQQISVGLSNDWLDVGRDKLAGRADKPSVSGLVKAAELRNGSIAAAVLAEFVAILLGGGAAGVMLLMLIFGWSYNLGLKMNWMSAIPYALGFGAVPVFVGLAAQDPYWVQPWVIAVSALLGVSAHFANVLPDMVADKLNGVRALPHILGQEISAAVIFGTAMLAVILTVSQSEQLPGALAAIGLVLMLLLAGSASLLSLRQKPPRIIFALLILASLTNVILLVVGISAGLGSSLAG